MNRPLALAFALALSVGTAGAQTFSFITSVGTQPTNVGTITLTQVNATTVNVLVDLINTPLPNSPLGYGFMNSGGQHTPFAFNLAGTETGVTATFIQPAGGAYAFGVLSLSTNDGSNTPFGTYGVTINSTAGNGSSNAYYGDLQFNLTRASGLSTTNFIQNGDGYYFSADLTNGANTGSQAWAVRATTTTPEPATLALMATGLLALGGAARRRKLV